MEFFFIFSDLVFLDSSLCPKYTPEPTPCVIYTAEPTPCVKETVTLDGSLPGDPETPKCATPTIIFANGELQFSCETEGVEYVSEVTASDAKKNYTNKVSLTGVYKVSVYAMKTGYENSDVATAEIKLSSAGGLKGDANGDGVIDIADAVKIVNIVVGKE